jgi:hypothetical protein
MDFAFVQAVTILIHEEVRLCARTKATVPAFRVIIQNLTRRGMQWYQTGLAKLASTNCEQAFGPVHIRGAKVQCFTEPKARDR